MRKGLSGFTLIELLVIVAIISILAVSAYIEWPGLSLNVGAQAAQVASDIRYTQMLAMSKTERFSFVRTSSTSYQIVNSSGTAIINTRGSTSMTLTQGVSFGTFTNLPNNLVAFDGKGTPYIDSTPPGTALTSTATISLVSSGGTKNILIAPETGRVTLS